MVTLILTRYLSIYLSYLYSTSPQIFTLYQKHFTIFTCPRPFSVSFLCEKEPPPPRSTPWGVYRCHGSYVHISASAQQPRETHNVSAFALLHPPTILQSGRSMVVGHVLMVHTCSFMCTNHVDMIAHTPAFLQVGEHSHHLDFHHTSSGWLAFFFSKTF